MKCVVYKDIFNNLLNFIELNFYTKQIDIIHQWSTDNIAEKVFYELSIS